MGPKGETPMYLISIGPGVTQEDTAISVEVGKGIEDMGQVLDREVKDVVVPGVDSPGDKIGTDNKGAWVGGEVVHEGVLRVEVDYFVRGVHPVFYSGGIFLRRRGSRQIG